MTASELVDRLTDRPGLSSALRVFVARLSEGTPIPLDEAARLLGWPEPEMNARLSSLPFKVERDEHGRIVGAGLTLRPTRHQFVIEGRRLFTWCALDALMFPILLGRTARVTSPCASTGRPVTMTIGPDGVRDLDPAEAVVSLVRPNGSGDIRRSFCNHVNFFASREAAGRHGAEHAEVDLVGVREAFPIAEQICRRLLEA